MLLTAENISIAFTTTVRLSKYESCLIPTTRKKTTAGLNKPSMARVGATRMAQNSYDKVDFDVSEKYFGVSFGIKCKKIYFRLGLKPATCRFVRFC